MKIWMIFPFLLILPENSVYSQQDKLYAGTNIPLYYSVGYEHSFNNKLSLRSQFSLLTKPYDEIILDILEIFDTDELLLNTIGEAFSYGYSIQPEINYHFRKNYIGLAYSYLSLTAKDHPSDIISNYLGIYLPTTRSVHLTVQSGIHNVGFLYGHPFDLKNPHLSIILEFSIQKTFASKTQLETDTIVDLRSLITATDNQLNDYYIKYGFLPAINLFLSYTFGEE